jgi:hypothetical protein
VGRDEDDLEGSTEDAQFDKRHGQRQRNRGSEWSVKLYRSRWSHGNIPETS